MLRYVKNHNISEITWLYLFRFISFKAQSHCFESTRKLDSEVHHVKQNAANSQRGEGEKGRRGEGERGRRGEGERGRRGENFSFDF
jgi:hypothetical protein